MPGVALDATVRVSWLVPLPGEAMLAGANAAVTPEGSCAVRAIAPLNPELAWVVTVTGADAPRVMEIEDTVVTVNCGFTVKVTEAVFVWLPAVAVTVRLYGPGTTDVVVESVSVLVPEPGALKLAGAKDAETPEGMPVIDSATAELNPPLTVTLTEAVACAPRVTLTADVLETLYAGPELASVQ